MARILIRNSDRRILFYTHDSLFSDIDNGVNALEAKYPGDTTFLTKSNNVPANIRLGWYINSTLDAVSAEPFGDVLVKQQRTAELNAKLDEHQAMIRDGAMLGIPAVVGARWYKYLRMMAQAVQDDRIMGDDAQWALVATSLDVDPHDFDGFTLAESNLFDETFADDGEYALGWFDVDTKSHPVRTDKPNDDRLIKSNLRYDLRFASKVRIIQDGAVDRTDQTVLPDVQRWNARHVVVPEINKRFPWYVSNGDSLLKLARFTPRVWPNFIETRFNRPGNINADQPLALLVVRPRSHSATTVITAGTLSSTNGSLNVPFNPGQTIDVVVVVTAGDGVHTSTYTYTITRRTV